MADQTTAPLPSLVDIWQDDKRMNSLFLPFRQRELNPVDYDSKMKFWQSSIENWAMEKNDGLVSVRKMESNFKRKERSPLCIGAVIENLYRLGELKTEKEFLNTSPSQSWTSWAVTTLIKTPVVWSFSKLKDAIIEEDKVNINYINIKFLKAKGNELLSYIKTKKKFLLSNDEVEYILKKIHPGMNSENVYLILHWLQLQKKVAVKMFEGRPMIKFSEKDEPITEAHISDADMAVFTLQQNKEALIKNMKELELEKEELVKAAKSNLKMKMRDMAKANLRMKKELEKRIEKRAAALDNIELMLSRLKEADSDAKVLESYKFSVSALKTTFKNAGLKEDSVTDTMDEVREVIDIHDEIQEALSHSIEPVMNDELEKELEDLISSEPTKPLSFPEYLPDVPMEELDRLLEKQLEEGTKDKKVAAAK